MKVKEFVEKYVGYVNYASDRNMIKKYADEELRIYAYCGADLGGHDKQYVTAMVFDTARLTVAFINGERANIQRALKLVSRIDMDSHTPVSEMKNLKKRAWMDNI